MDAMMACNNMFDKRLDIVDEQYKELSTNITKNVIK